jgi:hypothetical protein
VIRWYYADFAKNCGFRLLPISGKKFGSRSLRLIERGAQLAETIFRAAARFWRQAEV